MGASETQHGADESDPTPFLAALGLAVPEVQPRPARSTTAIFTSKGKGSNESEPDKPYGVLKAVNE